MNGWILGIVGVVFLGIMIEIIAPDGKTNTFIKSIFSLVFICVVMSPILNLVKQSGIDVSGLINSGENDFEEQLKIDTKLKIENYLFEHGIEGVEIEIDACSTINDIIINKIYVNLSNSVIIKNEEHIDKYKLITGLIMEVIDVSEENIVYG